MTVAEGLVLLNTHTQSLALLILHLLKLLLGVECNELFLLMATEESSLLFLLEFAFA